MAGPLPAPLGAQGAEIVALTEAAKYATGARVNIYTDSKYAFAVCHAMGTLWKERGFLTSAGKTVAHRQQIKHLFAHWNISDLYKSTHTETRHDRKGKFSSQPSC